MSDPSTVREVLLHAADLYAEAPSIGMLSALITATKNRKLRNEALEAVRAQIGEESIPAWSRDRDHADVVKALRAAASAMASAMDRGWNRAQVRRFVLDARNGNEHAWQLIPNLRRAILAERFAAIATLQEAAVISTARLSNLWADMLEEASKLPGGVP